jgi:DNA-binding GntR family transcriptional regulator
METTVFGDQPISSSIRQQVTDRIREAIIDMRLRPGDRLTERALVDWSGVSRATVREAIRELETMRLVEISPRRGAVVASLSVKDAIELYEIRASLEGIVARQCAERATDTQVIALRAAFEEMRVLAEGGVPRDALRAKSKVYEALFEGADNQTIHDILAGLQARITFLRSISTSRPGRLAQMTEEVRRIVEAIENRQPERAEAAAVAHVRSAGDAALAAIEEEATEKAQKAAIGAEGE